jgi:hypothetical protein
LSFDLDRPARAWVGHLPPAGELLDELDDSRFVGDRVHAKPLHRFGVAVHREQRLRFRRRHLAQHEALGFKVGKGWLQGDRDVCGDYFGFARLA